MFLNFNNDDGGLMGGLGRIGNLGGFNGGLAPPTGDLSMLFFNSPCKFYYAVNNSEWSDGIDLNLMNQKKAPLNLVVTMPPEMPEIPKSPKQSQQPTIPSVEQSLET